MPTLLAALHLKLCGFVALFAVQSAPSLDLLAQLLAAWNAHAWPLVGAICTMGLITLAKQGWFSDWIAARLPIRFLPYVAVLIGVLGVSSAEIVAGKPVVMALLDGIKSGMGAVFGHQAIVEGARNGKEILPPTAKTALSRSIPPPPLTPRA